MADWLLLPYDLIVEIANQLTEVGDFLSFSAVCHSWRLVYLNKDWIPRGQVPWLMLSDYHADEMPTRLFFSFSNLKYYRLPFPKVHGCRCWGTSQGWLVTVGGDSSIVLLNPISRVCINLPPCSTLNSHFHVEVDWGAAIQKVMVLKLCNEFVTMLMHKLFVAYARHGDSMWTGILFSSPLHLTSIVSFEDQIFALTVRGDLMLLDICGANCPRANYIASAPENEKRWDNLYLIELRENLLLVFRYGNLSSLKFKVNKFDAHRRKFVPLTDIGKSLILVDNYFCTAISAFGCFMPNCIYITGDNLDSLMLGSKKHLLCISVYSINNEATEVYPITAISAFRYMCPVWMMPALW